MTLDPTFVFANYAEACVWAGLAIVALVKRNGVPSYFLAGSLVAFGISDIVESRTGAWYDPWWLFAWKALCVLLILIFGISVLRKRRKSLNERI